MFLGPEKIRLLCKKEYAKKFYPLFQIADI